jgi:methylglutaconyl-CoA hydratase
MGLVTELVPREELSARAHALAAELLALSPESLRATKRLLRAQQAAGLDAALALAMEANAASRQTEDFREGVTAFVEKRKPVWPGK